MFHLPLMIAVGLTFGAAKTKNAIPPLKAVAERRGLTITFRRTRDETVIFHLEEPEAAKS